MVSIFGHSVYHFDVVTVWFCLLAVSQAAYVNVALNKPAYQQDPYSRGGDYDPYDASNAVDGRKSDLSSDGGQCAVSQPRQTATWWVNLTTIHSIHHITIYFMTNGFGLDFYTGLSNYFLGFSVYVSNTTDRLQGTLCYKDDNFTALTIPAVFTTTCPVHGQYVIYYNERLKGPYREGISKYAHNELCEVEVYGCNTTGYYGPECSIPCPDVNCQYCHIETGTCQGCKTGYQGHRCELEDKAAQTSVTVVFPILFSVIGLVLMTAGIFVFFKIKTKRFNQNGKHGVNDKNIELSSHGVVQHYDELHVRDTEETYTALKKAEEETPYEEI